MDGHSDEVLVASLLTALRMKGEAISELVGAARAMRQRAAKIPRRTAESLDTCGTGGDGLATFNISTATAIVAAAAGVPVAKHGNRAASSFSGSADVLEALGVSINLTPEQVGTCIDEVGIGFCFAPLCHGAMKNVAPVRKRLGFRTIFNLLGPLTNPARADYQLVGAVRNETAEKLARALAEFDVKRAVVVCGNDELDEVSLWGNTVAFVVDGHRVERHEWTPGDFGDGPAVAPADLKVSSPVESAEVIRQLLSGEVSAARQIVVANTAAALFAAGKVVSVAEGVNLASQAIDSGDARRTLQRLVDLTNRLTGSRIE